MMQRWLLAALLALLASSNGVGASSSSAASPLSRRDFPVTSSGGVSGVGAVCPSLAKTVCVTDADCVCEPGSWYNYTCTVGKCSVVLPAGQFCSQHSECASYPVLGDNACSADCSVDATCHPHYVGLAASVKCCKGVELLGNCTAVGEKQNPCAQGLTCTNDALKNKSQYRCEAFGTRSEWIIGAAIALTAAIFINIGLNFQKLGFRLEQQRPENVRRPVYLLPWWILGFFIWIAGNLGTFAALHFAAQSLVAPLGAVSLLCNSIVAPLMNKEPFGIKDLIAVVLIAGGTVVTVIFSSHQSIELGICELLALYRRSGTIIYIVLLGVLLLFVYSTIRVIEANLLDLPATSNPDDDIAVAKARAKSRIRGRVERCWSCSWLGCGLRVARDGFAARTMLPFCYATLGGLFAATTILFAKSSIELIRTSMRPGEDNQFAYPHAWIIVLLLVFTAVMQVYWISAGLSRYEALVQIPVFHVAFTLFGVISAGVYFDEFKNMSAKEIGCFVLGVLLTFVGVIVLSFRTADKPKEPAPVQQIQRGEDVYQMFDPADPPEDPNAVEKTKGA